MLTEDRQVRRLSITDFPPPLVPGRMKIGKHFNPKEAASRRNLAAALRARLGEIDPDPAATVKPEAIQTRRLDSKRLRAAVRRHPCTAARNASASARWAERAQRLGTKAPGWRPG